MKHGPLVALVAVAALLTGQGAAQAAPPANDYFGAATPLAVGQEISGTNLEATFEPGEPNHNEGAQSASCAALTDGPQCASSVWFTFEAPSMGTYTIETCDMGTDTDTILALYTGASVATAEKVISNDDAPVCPAAGSNFGSRLVFKSGAGITYHVALTGFLGFEGSFYIRAYAGEELPRPKPDTGIVRFASFLNATNGAGTGSVMSGPRHSPGFPVESDVPGATFGCSLDGGPFAACEPPVSYAGLAPGSTHVFEARASAGGATDPTPVIQRFTVDPTGPETTFGAGPSGTTSSQEATWTASSGERNNIGEFTCHLDGHEPFVCGFKSTFKDLCQGPHDFGTGAVDRAGNVDPTPAQAHIEVTSGPACAAPTIGPVGPPTPSVTVAGLEIPYDDKGAGGNLRTEYGLTTAYGMRLPDQAVDPGPATMAGPVLRYLSPATEYHYRVTITTPFGSASTGDQTVTTKPLEGTLPIPENTGAPRVGYFTASLPISIDPQGVDTFYFALVDTATPVTLDSPTVITSDVIDGTGAGPQGRAFQLVDLEPGTTYHYRIAAAQSGMTTSNEALGPEGSFTTLALPVAASPPIVKKRFRLRRGQVKVGRLKRHSKFLFVRIKRLPAKSKAKLKLNVGRSKQSARKRAKANGRARFRMRLSKRIRKALLDERVKRFKLKVTALPRAEPPSSVTFRKRIRG